MKKLRPILIQAGSISIATLSLITIFHAAITTGALALKTKRPDDVTLFKNRFTAAQSSLPHYGIAGYATEASPAQVMQYSNTQAEYFLTQYALAPLVIDNDPFHCLVVGNFHNSPLPDISPYGRFAVITDTGNGIIILRCEEGRL